MAFQADFDQLVKAFDVSYNSKRLDKYSIWATMNDQKVNVSQQNPSIKFAEFSSSPFFLFKIFELIYNFQNENPPYFHASC